MTSEVAVALKDVEKSFETRARKEGAGDEGKIFAVRDVNLDIRRGEFFTLLGPSGCGKTTTLRMIAGFEQPTLGQIFITGQALAGVPAHLRPVNTVFQSYALFPHMSVFDNVAFGLKVKGVARDEIRRRAGEALELVRMSEMGDRRPSELSGGQQQRVGIARALVNRPAVLLLDEPFGALDLKLRKEMQLEIKNMQRQLGITFIFVTHDQEEALTMSDRIAVMNKGRVLQVGSPVDIYERPSTKFGADFIGEMNFIEAGRLAFPLPAGVNADKAVLAFRPEAVKFHDGEEHADRLGFDAVVADTIYIGTDLRYILDLAEGLRVVLRSQNSAGAGREVLQPGARVRLSVHKSDIRILTE
ncbi:ABC transporter ATP-binding protein [Aestuariivirga sp. YIM B02566]|uniref:ABC transporter ATP-binding protein n=1 Tax=Taklimakanibacter albus TaxID=2800327 RepID=A0ACC5RB11_9HYPH|nr:ABC transporter ATP-binding protein [Aestuariivirga sp. YIM B02566]MBK1869779.1 ABC transporter ATP-binding protein [Aestuariivirga sp. YIM B02566]